MKTSIWNSIALAGAFAIGLSGCAAAQTLTRPDPAGEYRLQFKDLDGIDRSMTIEATDLVNPRITAAVTQSGANWTYSYSLSNDNSGWARPNRGVWLWKAACGARGASVTIETPSPWRAAARDLGSLKVCEFQIPTSAPLVDPGMTATGFSITSTDLPMIGLVRVFGSADVPNWPVEADRISRAVLALADSVSGLSYFDHGGAEVWTLLPLRSPASISTGTQGISALKSDLGRACGELSWVSNRGVCHSLEVKLDNAASSFRHGQADAAKAQISAFLSELSAQKGKAVNEGAFTLLSALGTYVLSRF